MTQFTMTDLRDRIDTLESERTFRIEVASTDLAATSGVGSAGAGWELVVSLPPEVEFDGTWTIHCIHAYAGSSYLVAGSAVLERDWPINASQSYTRASMFSGGGTEGTSQYFVRTNAREIRVDYNHASFDVMRVFFHKL